MATNILETLSERYIASDLRLRTGTTGCTLAVRLFSKRNDGMYYEKGWSKAKIEGVVRNSYKEQLNGRWTEFILAGWVIPD